jgi:hypothetical protein
MYRHEFGHNYGHPHHMANSYNYREGPRGGKVYDGWDMMSGGNGFTVSHLAAGAKWHFGWMSDDAVIWMQPEGSTGNCPDCYSSLHGVVLQAFDNPAVLPSSTNQMAVHIPILGNGNDMYSYWLS